MPHGKKAALKTPSAACAAGCREKPTWRLSLTIACSRWFVPIITLRESVSTTKPQQRFSAMICCTSDVNPPSRFRRNDERVCNLEPFDVWLPFVRRDARQFTRDVSRPNASLKSHRWPDGSGTACCCRRDCRLRARAILSGPKLRRRSASLAPPARSPWSPWTTRSGQRIFDANPSSVQRLCSSTSFCLS